ncbi:MAG: polysaccharide biosynthesis protein [Oscillospiraceae bacterium]|nr:polysaccharide biosynthesis protein [Oscillospiraceae bacterium]
MSRNSRSKSIIENAAVLFIAMAITKAVGAMLKIPLGNILGGLGMSYFSSAYSVFGPVFALTAAAVPTVLSRIIAGEVAIGKFKNVRKIRRIVLSYAAMLGFCGTILILVITVPFARIVTDAPKSIPSMLLIAPSVFFCCIAAVYRGYYEGLLNALPTAISQVVEAVVKSVLGVTFAYIVLNKTDSLSYAAAAAVLGITISEIAGMLFLFFRSFSSDGITKEELDLSPPSDSAVSLLKKFLSEAFPITLGALAINLNSLIDLLTITGSINYAVNNNRAFFLARFTYELASGVESKELGNFIYGCYTGIVASIFTLIPAMTGMLGKSALPAVAAAWERRDTTGINRNLRILFKGTFVLGLPLCLGMAAFAKPVLNLLYSAKPAEAYVCVQPLFILSLGGIALSLTGTLFSIFLAIGRADLPVKLMLTGAIIKLCLNLLLIRIPELNISGAAIATIGCYAIICVFGMICLKRLARVKIGIPVFFVKAFFNSILCIFTALIFYNYVFMGSGRVFQLALSVITGAGVYAMGTFVFDRNAFTGYFSRLQKAKK